MHQQTVQLLGLAEIMHQEQLHQPVQQRASPFNQACQAILLVAGLQDQREDVNGHRHNARAREQYVGGGLAHCRKVDALPHFLGSVLMPAGDQTGIALELLLNFTRLLKELWRARQDPGEEPVHQPTQSRG